MIESNVCEMKRGSEGEGNKSSDRDGKVYMYGV